MNCLKQVTLASACFSDNRNSKGTAVRAAIFAMTVITCVFATGTSAIAQRDPMQQKVDYLWNGPRGYSAHSAGTRMYDARQYTQRLYEYSQCAPAVPVTPAITKVESEHIGQTLQAAKQNLAAVKKESEKTKDQTVLKKLEAVNKHLTSAMEQYKMMDMECCKDETDAVTIASCCDDVITELDKALAEHASLMRLLDTKGKTAIPATAPAPKK